MIARPWLAYTLSDYAEMLVARGAPGDRKRAEELLSCGGATYRELGPGGALIAAYEEMRQRARR
jgi:hypothetical protein